MAARASIEYLCRILKSFGIQLTPELLRRAKFNEPESRQGLLRAVHDVILCEVAGWPQGCGAGVASVWQQVAQEQASEEVPPEGLHTVCHYLTAWGCLPALIARLTSANTSANSSISRSGSGSSRALLLTLSWLCAHCRLFQRALQHCQLPPDLLPLLPPFAPDSAHSSATAACYSHALQRAQQHAARVHTALKSAHGWTAVEAAAHQALLLQGQAASRLRLLASLLDGRERLLHQVAAAQLPVTRVTLTAFELQLLARPALLAKHQAALQRAAGLLQQQLACAQHAQVFFAWAGSVLDEDARDRDTAATAGTAEAPAAACAAGTPRGANAQTSSSSEMASLVRQLPESCLPVAQQVLLRVQQQLLQAAGPLVVTTPAAANAAVTLAGAEQLGRFHEAAAAAVLGGCQSLLLPQPELVALPPDLQQAVNRSLLLCTEDIGAQAAPGAGPHAWHRRLVEQSEEQAGASGGQRLQGRPQPPPQQQRQRQQQQGVGAAAEASQALDAGRDAERLQAAALAVARQLARVRAAAKQELALAGAALLPK